MAANVVAPLRVAGGVLLRRTWSAFTRSDRPATPETLLPGGVPSGGVATHVLLDRALRQRTLVQSTTTTCGSATLVVARMLADEAYLLQVLKGPGARERFAAQEQVIKRSTNGLRGPAGSLQLPWPSALGTPPWGTASAMTRLFGPRLRYRVRAVDSDSRPERLAAFGSLASTVAAGNPAVLYVGDDLTPRHVTLALSVDDDGLRIYDPAVGRLVTVARSAFEAGRVGVAGWQRVWAVVEPVWET